MGSATGAAEMENEMATWNEMLREVFAARGDDFSKMTCTVGADQLNTVFDDGYGVEEGCAFTA